MADELSNPDPLIKQVAAPLAPAPALPQPVVSKPAAPVVKPVPAAPAAPVGVSDAFLNSAMMHESGGKLDARNAGTGAYGLYQFMPATWAAVAKAHPELNLGQLQGSSREQQTAAYRAFVADNAKILGAHGIAPTDKNLFMASFFGAGGAAKFIKTMQQNPNANAASLFPLEAKYNRGVFIGPNGAPRTMGQVYALMTAKFGGPDMPASSAVAAAQPGGAQLPPAPPKPEEEAAAAPAAEAKPVEPPNVQPLGLAPMALQAPPVKSQMDRYLELLKGQSGGLA